jgi:hypothetical protein
VKRILTATLLVAACDSAAPYQQERSDDWGGGEALPVEPQGPGVFAGGMHIGSVAGLGLASVDVYDERTGLLFGVLEQTGDVVPWSGFDDDFLYFESEDCGGQPHLVHRAATPCEIPWARIPALPFVLGVWRQPAYDERAGRMAAPTAAGETVTVRSRLNTSQPASRWSQACTPLGEPQDQCARPLGLTGEIPLRFSDITVQ